MDAPNFIVGVVSACAALGALFYARKSPTQADLNRVEGHIAGMEAHIRAQAERDAIRAMGRSISLKVSGIQSHESIDGPLILNIGLDSSGFIPTSIELLTAQQLSLKTILVENEPSEGNVAVSIPSGDLYKWYKSGIHVGGTNTKQVLLNVHGRFVSGEVSRVLTLDANQVLRTSEPLRSQVYVLTIAGSI